MNVRSVIFDIDGTLVDTSGDITASVNAVRIVLGRTPIGSHEAMRHIGAGVDGLLLAAVCEHPDQLAFARQQYLAHQADHLHDQSTLYPSVVEGLEQFAARGIQLSVVSNKADRLLAPLLRHFNIVQHFTHILGEESQPSKKPAPDGLLVILREQGIDPAQALMVGDSWQDIAAGKDAGCGTVWCRYGFGSADGYKADFIAEVFADVLSCAVPGGQFPARTDRA